MVQEGTGRSLCSAATMRHTRVGSSSFLVMRVASEVGESGAGGQSSDEGRLKNCATKSDTIKFL